MSAHPPTPNELSLDSNVASAIHTYRELWYVRRATDPVNERISYEVKTNALLEWIFKSIVLDERRHPVPTGPVRSLGRSSRAPSSSLGLRQQWLYFQRRY
ncbi:hypothetical protein JCM3775_006537 [Rhodotorula graminis]